MQAPAPIYGAVGCGSAKKGLARYRLAAASTTAILQVHVCKKRMKNPALQKPVHGSKVGLVWVGKGRLDPIFRGCAYRARPKADAERFILGICFWPLAERWAKFSATVE